MAAFQATVVYLNDMFNYFWAGSGPKVIYGAPPIGVQIKYNLSMKNVIWGCVENLKILKSFEVNLHFV